MKKIKMKFENLLIDDIEKNPKNWRKHPNKQKRLLKSVINEIGWVGAILYNRRTNHIIDGHLRVDEAIGRGEKEVPGIVVDIPIEDEEKILATFDRIVVEANKDKEIYVELIKDIDYDDEMLKLDAEKIIKDVEKIANPDHEIIPEMLYKAKYIIMVFKDDLNWEWAKNHYDIGQKIDPKTNRVEVPYVINGDKYVEEAKI